MPTCLHSIATGALFAGMAILNNIVQIASSAGFNSIYNWTLAVFPGAVFIVCAGCFLLALVFTM